MGNKIPITREIKIAILNALKTGYLDLTKIPDLMKEIQGMNAFLELMKEVGADDEADKPAGNNIKPDKL